MTIPLGFDTLKGILHRRIAHLPDHRKASPNTQYAIHKAALGAFGIFFTQSPSFLEYQRRLQHAKGQNNAHTLFDVEQIPCDNQVRKLLDPMAPSHLDAVFLEVFERLEQHRMLAPHGVTLLGDDLYSNQPFCALVLQHGFNFIFTCKPDSHAKLYERLAFWQATDAMATREVRHWNGRFTEVTMVRYLNDVFLRSGHDTLSVNWFEITVVNAKTGEQLYHNSCITNHRLTADNVVAVAQSGRGRWKIENENNNVLKTKGYHLEHNFGHGKRYLAAFLLSLNLLAFLFHTVLEWSDPKYALLRQALARRQTFFHDIQAFMRYMAFDHWDHLMEFMIRGLELASQCDTG